jgi:putative flavoprotein involved in K+ transport
MYLMGLQFMRRRKSALIDGAGDDAHDLTAHIVSWLGRQSIDPAAKETIEWT